MATLRQIFSVNGAKKVKLTQITHSSIKQAWHIAKERQRSVNPRPLL